MKRTTIKQQDIFSIIQGAARPVSRDKFFGINGLDKESVRGA